MTVKATGPHFNFVMFVFKVERGRRGGGEHWWEAEAQDPMWQTGWDFSLRPEGKRMMFEFCWKYRLKKNVPVRAARSSFLVPTELAALYRGLTPHKQPSRLDPLLTMARRDRWGPLLSSELTNFPSASWLFGVLSQGWTSHCPQSWEPSERTWWLTRPWA